MTKFFINIAFKGRSVGTLNVPEGSDTPAALVYARDARRRWPLEDGYVITLTATTTLSTELEF